MKIIRPSRRFKSAASSRNVSNNEEKHETLSHDSAEAGALIKKNKQQSRVRSKARSGSKLNSKPRNAGFKSENSEFEFKQSLSAEEEFDFDTSKLEAMPRYDLVEAVPEGKKRRRSELSVGAECEPLQLTADPAKKEFNEIFARGVRLLAMREHSVKEITTKLLDKSENSDVIHAVIDELLASKYLSDERFTESYVRARKNRGFGPVKIKSELKNKGISNNLIQDHLDEGAAIWFDNALSQYQKKYGDVPISDYNGWTKRARFMQSRGFTMEHIQVTVPRIEFD